ncbi:Uncharacterised protein [Mycobacteroides abscessus subsp. abscessus]|nr:Uncharacterised protein [Mycobacteroides abscessus subsp. abscessus]
MLGATLEMFELKPTDVVVTFDSHEAAQYAGFYINRFYPMYKQVNALRSGSKEERDKMDKFIDSCRAWSNDDRPELSDLMLIVP